MTIDQDVRADAHEEHHATDDDAIDLSALAPKMVGRDFAIDEQSGLYVARLPTAHRKYSILLAPGWEVSYSQLFGKSGTEQLTIKRIKRINADLIEAEGKP